MNALLLSLLTMAQAYPIATEAPYDDYMVPAIFSWCEDNKVVQNNPETNKVEVADDCTAQQLKCTTKSELNEYMKKYIIYSYCSEK